MHLPPCGKSGPGPEGRESKISISNRSQLIYMANASLVVKSKMGHIHLHTHPLHCHCLYPKLPQALQVQSINCSDLGNSLQKANSLEVEVRLSLQISGEGRRKWPSRILPPVHTPLPTPENNTIDISWSANQDHQGKKRSLTSHTLTYPSQQLEAVTIGGNVN